MTDNYSEDILLGCMHLRTGSLREQVAAEEVCKMFARFSKP